MIRHRAFLAALLPASLLGASCGESAPNPWEGQMTYEEASFAVRDLSASEEAAMATAATINLASRFEAGGAVEEAALEIRDAVVAALPCAEASVNGATVRIEYGAKAGGCALHENAYSGIHTITVRSNEADIAVTEHGWEALSDQRVIVSGTAEVTWSRASQSRRVVDELEWEAPEFERTGVGSSDRTESVAGDDFDDRFVIDGHRAWTTDFGDWSVDITGIERDWADAAPVAGTYIMLTPTGRRIRVRFLLEPEFKLYIAMIIDDGKVKFILPLG